MQIQIDVPVAPGTPVYVVERCNCGLHYKPNCRQLLGNPTGNAKAIAIVPSIAKSKTNMAYCWKIFVRPFDPSKHLKNGGQAYSKLKSKRKIQLLKCKNGENYGKTIQFRRDKRRTTERRDSCKRLQRSQGLGSQIAS